MMTIKQAEEIVKNWLKQQEGKEIPSIDETIPFMDVQRAKGFLVAVEKFKPVIKAIEHTLKYPAAEFHYVQNRAIREALEQYRRDFLGDINGEIPEENN